MSATFPASIRHFIFNIHARGKSFSTHDLMRHFGWTDRQNESMNRVLREMVKAGEIFRISDASVKPSKGVAIEYSTVPKMEKIDIRPITLYTLMLEGAWMPEHI